MTAVNSPAYLTGQGYKGANNNKYLATNFIPQLTSNYQLNSASRGAWLFNNTATEVAGGCIDGLLTSNDNCLLAIPHAAQRINQGVVSLTETVDLSGVGFKAINRINSNTLSIINNDVRSTHTSNSVAIVNSAQSVLKRGTSNYSLLGISAYWMGADLDDKAAQLKAALTIYFS